MGRWYVSEKRRNLQSLHGVKAPLYDHHLHNHCRQNLKLYVQWLLQYQLGGVTNTSAISKQNWVASPRLRLSPSKHLWTVCSWIFLVYLFIWCACISYGRFIAISYKFKLSTYVQEPLVIGRRGCVQREISTRKQLAADNGHKQSSEKEVAYERDVSEGVQVKWLRYFTRKWFSCLTG